MIEQEKKPRKKPLKPKNQVPERPRFMRTKRWRWYDEDGGWQPDGYAAMNAAFCTAMIAAGHGETRCSTC